MKKHKLYEVFTIIEVVLVLAITGLIFLAVFLALSALQRSIRDKSRKDSVARTVAIIKTYRSNSGRQIKFSDEYKSYSFTKNNSGEWETSGEYYVVKLQIVLGSYCEMYKLGEGEYPRFNPNKSMVAIHLEVSDYYCEEF